MVTETKIYLNFGNCSKSLKMNNTSSHFSQSISRHTIEIEILKFTLELYNNKLLSRAAADSVIDHVDALISNIIIPHIQNELRHEISSTGMEVVYHKIHHVLENNKCLFTLFDTEHKRMKYYREKCSYISPQLYELGDLLDFEEQNPYSNKNVGDKKAYGAYVSIPETFKTVFSNSNLFHEMYNYALKVSQEKQFLTNIIQGKLWRYKYKYDLLQKLIFPIYVYYDEFVLGDPLGSHALQQKLGGIYVSLACLPPHLISKSSNVYLSSLFHSKYLKEFKNKSAFKKIIEDIKILSEEGMEVMVDGEKKQIYFECVLVLSDNLGINSICGFCESFSGTKYCRICRADKYVCMEQTRENVELLRTKSNYDEEVKINDSKQTGITEECVFNVMKNFHCAENKTLDEMHDVVGVCEYTLGKVIDFHIKNGDFDLDTLNNRINSFPFNATERPQKPMPILYDKNKKGAFKIKIKQSAAEIFCLTRYFGLIIGDKIKTPSKHWKLYTYLRGIVGILTKPYLDQGEIQEIEQLVYEHNQLFLELYGKLKPKMHFLLHYPRIIEENGPAVHYSSLKFEQKNHVMKKAAVGTTSSINLPITVAIRNQLSFCYELNFSPPISSEAEFGPLDKHNSDENHYKLKHVRIYNKLFSPGTVCITRFETDGIIFGIIKNIFYKNQNNAVFQLQEFKTIYFGNHYQAYRVVNSENDDVFLHLNQIPFLPPCLYYKGFDGEFIATRYKFV